MNQKPFHKKLDFKIKTFFTIKLQLPYKLQPFAVFLYVTICVICCSLFNFNVLGQKLFVAQAFLQTAPKDEDDDFCNWNKNLDPF